MSITAIAAGRNQNAIQMAIEAALEDGAARVTVTSELTGHEKERLANGHPSETFRFASADANQSAVVDLNVMRNGGFETAPVGGELLGWKVVSGTPLQGAARPGSDGTKSVYLSDLNARLEQLRYFQAGQRLNVRASCAGNTSSTAAIHIQNARTGKYLRDTDGAWLTAKTAFATSSSSTYDDASRDGVVLEDLATCRDFWVPLLISCDQTAGSQNVFFDDIEIWPSWTTSALINHDFPAAATIRVASSPDNSAWTNRVLHQTFRPNVWHELGSAIDARYIRLRCEEAMPTPNRYVGEWYVCTVFELADNPVYPHSEILSAPGAVSTSASGLRRQVNYADSPRAEFTLAFEHTLAEFQELRDEAFVRSRMGKDKVLLLTDTSETDKVSVWLGTLEERLQSSKPWIDFVESRIKFTEASRGRQF